MESTWISSRRAGWTPYQWSVFGQTVRTNNDVEGWHNNLNKLCERAGASCNVYELIDVLYKECSLVTVQHQLVAQEKLEKHQKASDSLFKSNVIRAWEAYRQKELSPKQLLNRIAGFLYSFSVMATRQQETVWLVRVLRNEPLEMLYQLPTVGDVLRYHRWYSYRVK
ncbi:hypothetical protein GWK47_026652 [Chionoecetes opilio]|uniref:Uncharacterized protein n=1 Tax=Chionoecetes opilio TaxID=41210 RepID=A0A8J8WNH7_CHIOP|nr:hypothetical protein GWK47_026652 [Chionoecetes opilio]